MLKTSKGKSLNDSKKKDLTQTLTFTVAPDLKTSSSINILRMVCDGKITQIHEYFHHMTIEAKKDPRKNVNEDIAIFLNTPDSLGKTPLFYAL